MKSFILSMLLGAGLATAVVLVGARALLPESAWEGPSPTSTSMRPLVKPEAGPIVPFTQAEAIEVVAARLGRTQRGERMRQTLSGGALVTHHSPGHWTVRLNEATWTAHSSGAETGRYAEPDNDPARAFEHESTLP